MQVSAWDDDNEGVEVEPDPQKNDFTKILWAAENGLLDVVEELVTKDRSLVHTTDKDGYTPLHRACYNGHDKVVQYLLRNGATHEAKTLDEWQPLHSACRWDNATCAEILIEFGADINAKSTGGQTPLHLAASNSYAKNTLELLLRNEKIKPDLKNSSGETALEIARRTGKYYRLFEIVEPCINTVEKN